MQISEKTLDDILRAVLGRLLAKRTWVSPSKGETTEITGVCLQLTAPRARLSRSELKGTLFSCLGELMWYLAGSNRLDFIKHYIRAYAKFSDDKRTLYGAYGPRLFRFKGVDQVRTVINLLRKKPDTRQAVIQLFEARDIVAAHKDVPCTCLLQFMLRGNRLHLFTYMRSNDAYLGLPHDVFAFTMLQELVARNLGVSLGTYNHIVGSLHLYKRDRERARRFLREGWQSSVSMPTMPSGSPWPSVRALLEIERAIRIGKHADIAAARLPPYWQDIARLLLIYKQFTLGDGPSITRTMAKLHARIYSSYVEDKIRTLANHGRGQPLDSKKVPSQWNPR